MSENFLTSFAAFAYGSDPEGKIILSDSGVPIWESQTGMVWVEDAYAFSSNDRAGYWMVNTGNPTRDAIATIAMNEIGADNFYRVVTNARKGEYLDAAREAMFGVAELGLALTGVGKLGQAAVRSPQAFRAARAVAGQRRVNNRFTQNMAGGFLDRTRTALFGGRYVDPSGPTGPARTVWRNGQRTQVPGGPVVQTRSNAYRVLADRYNNHGLLRNKDSLVRGTVRSTARAIGSGLAAALPKGKRGGRIGMALYPLSILGMGLSRMSQAAAEEETANAGTLGTDDDVFDNVGSLVADATSTAQNDAAGIQRQYGNILRELQGMYNLSETEDEKERIRFMLADIEAQRDAGLRAISEGYSKTVGEIRARATLTRQESAQRAGEYSSELSLERDMSRQRMIDQQAAQVAGNRGLGSGAGVNAGENEWIDLMSRYPEIQQRSTQRMGDITAEGIDWLADTTSSQGQAQQADLQRLAAATRSNAIMSHQQQVSNRIMQEQAELRDATMRLRMSGVSSGGASRPTIDNLALREQIAQLGGINYSDRAIRNYFEPVVGRQLTPSEMAVAAYERRQYLARQTAQAAGSPVGSVG
jgi:hypothetical protein